MINSKKTILQYTKPQIVLDELSIGDTTGGSVDQIKAGRNTDAKFFGYGLPMIRINAFLIKDLRYFNLDLNSQIPSVIFKFSTQDERFLYASYPKDGDLASLYIRSTSSLYKPIRIDFTITEVLSPLSQFKSPNSQSYMEKSDGRFNAFTIKAEMRIPGLYKHRSKAFKNKTSWEALLEISNDLKLGFSSNEKNTADAMTWLCPSIHYRDFIKDLSVNSWLGEEDFFDWWIDPYYNLNFVNLRKQFYENDDVQEMVQVPFGVDEHGGIGPDGSQKDAETEFPLMLTNDVKYRSFPIFIESFSLEHASGMINNETGYFRSLQFYDDHLVSDKPKNKFVTYPIESLTKKNPDDREISQKGRYSENFYKDETTNIYGGTYYFENVHGNYQQSYFQNYLNKIESYKTVLKVQTKMYMPFLYRGQNIQVNMVHHAPAYVPSLSATDNNTNPIPRTDIAMPDRFLSGRYVILGSSIEWKDGKIKQIFSLGKREWGLNYGDASNPSPDIKIKQ